MPGRLKMPIWKIRFSYKFIYFILLFFFFLRLWVSPWWMSRPQTAMFQLEWLARFKWRGNGWRSASLSPYGVRSTSFCILLPHQSNTTVSFDTTLHSSPERLLVEIGSRCRYKTRVKVSAGKRKWPLWRGGRCREVLVVSLWMTPFREVFEHLKETQNTVTVIKWLDREQDWHKHWLLVCW